MESVFAKITGGRLVAGLAVLAAVGLVGGYGVAMRARPKPVALRLGSPAPAGSHDPAHRIYVDVAGRVHKPGLYHLIDGARVDDAVRAAGGVLPDGDLDALNLATKLKDGDKVLVPRRGQTSADGAGAGEQVLLNLNTATVAQLDGLPGIGPALAQRIVAYRTQHGGFRTVSDLQNVSGIGPAKFAQIKDLVTV